MIQRPYLKSSVTVPPAMSVFMIMHVFLFRFQFLVGYCIRTYRLKRFPASFPLLIPSNLSLRRMYVEHWIIWYICRSWLAWEPERYHMTRLSSGFESIKWGCTSRRAHSIAVEDPREMTSGIRITFGRRWFTATFREYSASEAQC